ncbi:RNA-binding protein [Gottschalkiaceae bacterium SANA]|nr:RNA-binding protein [Gottschalkiaceae bacterium SANA]
MERTTSIQIGQVVRSKTGRDKDRVFLVSEILDLHYVMLIDGDLRRLANPKKKKIKHLVVYQTVLKEFQERLDSDIKINNAYLRRLLAPYNEHKENR